MNGVPCAWGRRWCVLWWWAPLGGLAWAKSHHGGAGAGAVPQPKNLIEASAPNSTIAILQVVPERFDVVLGCDALAQCAVERFAMCASLRLVNSGTLELVDVCQLVE